MLLINTPEIRLQKNCGFSLPHSACSVGSQLPSVGCPMQSPHEKSQRETSDQQPTKDQDLDLITHERQNVGINSQVDSEACPSPAELSVETAPLADTLTATS